MVMVKRLSRQYNVNDTFCKTNPILGQAQSVALRPLAKVNLSLVVFGPRPDGFHDLHTVMATVDLHDDLTLRRKSVPGIELVCTGEACPTGRENLVYRAVELLAEQAQINPALGIRLHKRIPAGAGLGGASSDAASCLLGLNRLWNLNLSCAELTNLAARLGSDVPFFLQGPVAVCTGRGEVVIPLPHRCTRTLLLIVPKQEAPTAQVYRHYRHEEKRCDDYMRRVNYFLRQGDLDGLVIQMINSLDDACMKLFESLRQLRGRIESMGIAPLQISGSGSSLFASTYSNDQANRWAEQLQTLNDASVRAVRFYTQKEPYLEVHHANL
jgi:4-diphosphocytidyl-2-C-methyl-D-erythritol kinase